MGTGSFWNFTGLPRQYEEAPTGRWGAPLIL